jgi:hypothetical protein
MKTQPLPYYDAIPDLTDVYLEDSYVMAISETDIGLMVEMVFVLRKGHPLYIEPAKDAYYCYHGGSIIFDHPAQIQWIEKKMKKFTDENGNTDYGTLHSLNVEGGTHALHGEFGRVNIITPKEVKIVMTGNDL